MLERLPKDTLTTADCLWLKCPWCGIDMAGAQVSLGAVHEAHVNAERGLRWARRGQDGRPDDGAIEVDCPTCGKPSIAAFQMIHRTPATRLLPVRTAADVAFASATKFQNGEARDG